MTREKNQLENMEEIERNTEPKQKTKSKRKSDEKKEVDFTTGNIYKKMFMYSVPLLLGNLLQQIYFIADSIVVGQLIGKTALAAVGAASSVTIILIFFFQGLCTGASIMISQNIGAGKIERIKRIVIASSIIVFVLGGLCSIFGFFLTGNILNWISVPKDIFDPTYRYLLVAVGGILPMLIYNMGAAILQAMGDSKTPLYYLAVASVINIVLDIVFVHNLNFGVESTAAATVIAQFVAGIFIFITIQKRSEEIKNRVSAETYKASKDRISNIIKKILYLGFPIGVQQVVIHIANIVIQNHINQIGTDAIAGWSIFCRIDTFVLLPYASFGIAIMNFTGQNYGAGKTKRIFEGVKAGMIMSIGVTWLISAILCIFPEFFFNFFTKDPSVLEYACQMIWCMVPGYALLAGAKVYSSAISGVGNAFIPMIINVLFMCVLRIVVLPIFTQIGGHNMTVLYWTFWLSWIVTFIVSLVYYRLRTKKQLMKGYGMV